MNDDYEVSEEEIIEAVQKNEIARKVMFDFDYKIRERGSHYFAVARIDSCFKVGNKYLAKVQGTHMYPYKVEITYDAESDKYSYECNCPYPYNCKHEYAVILAIGNNEFQELELKEEIFPNDPPMEEIFKVIPAEELKQFLLESTHQNQTDFNMVKFNRKFKKYYPRQSYEFFYNNLYNAILLKEEYDLMKDNFERLDNNIYAYVFDEAFDIIRGIINAYADASMQFVMHSKNFRDILERLEKPFRIVFREANDELRQRIYDWNQKLLEQNYYDSIYIKDFVLTVIS